MASPLNWFRRNAIWIMVPVGIFCMAFFGLGAVFEQFTTNIRSGSRANPVLAKWKGGEFTRNEVSRLTENHYGVLRLINGLEKIGMEEKGDEFVRLVSPIRPVDDRDPDFLDRQIIDRKLMAERAKSEGLKISEAMIDDYLALAAGGGEVTPQLIKQVNRQVNGGRIALPTIRRQLEIELLSQKMNMLTMTGLPIAPNLTESIEHYGKTARKIECQVLPVMVSDYVDDSLNPTQSEMRALYNEGKLEFRDPTGKRPGFKIPPRLKVQYFAASFGGFLDRVSADLTDKEIQEQYDQLVEQESELVMEVIPAEDLSSGAKPSETLETNDDPLTEDSDDPAPAPSSESSDTSFNVTNVTNFQFVSTRVQETAPQTTEGGTDIVDGVKEGGETTQKVEGNPTVVSDTPLVEERGSVESTPVDQSETNTASTVRDSQDEPGGLADMIESADSDSDEDAIGPLLGDDEDSVVKRAKPLSAVEGMIRRQLRGSEATEAMRVALATAENELENYDIELIEWEEAREPKGEKPSPPDLQAIADDNGLRLGETDLVSYVEMQETEIGKEFSFRGVTLAAIMFSKFKQMAKYAPNVFNEGRTSYVYWPTEIEDVQVPKLEDCKDEVIKFWRRKKALQSALEAANAIAAKASIKNQLTTIDPDKAGPTGEFTWFQIRNRETVFSSPIGVESAGEAFMETAFSLKQGEAGAAPNEKGDIIYVIQATTTATDVLTYGDEYIKDQLFKFQRMPVDVGMVNAHYFRERQRDLNREYVDSMDFDNMK